MRVMTQETACSQFPACSGCSAIGRPYDEQLAEKLQRVRQLFADAALPEFDSRFITRITPSPDAAGYRNRVKLVPRRVGGDAITDAEDDLVVGAGHIKLGLYRAGSHDVVDIPGCPVQMAGVNEVVEAVREGIDTCSISLYDETTCAGDLRFVTVRQGAATGELLVGFVTLASDFPGGDKLASFVTSRCSGVVGVLQNVNPAQGNVIFGDASRLISGRAYLHEAVCGVRLRLGLTSFFQVNTGVAELAYSALVRGLLLDHRVTFLDLYSGVGAIGLAAAGSVHRVVGIEEVAEAVDFARDAANDNAVSNVEFRTGLVEDRLPELVNELRRMGVNTGRLVVAVNPPRKGLDPKVLSMLRRMGSVRLAYLSCSPPTLIRDLAVFMEKDYRVRQVELFDMFPQTDQVETLVILEKRQRVAIPARPAARKPRKRDTR